MTPKGLRHFNAIATAAWVLVAPFAMLTELKDSVPFLVGVSVYALIVGHFSAWQAARAEEEAARGESG